MEIRPDDPAGPAALEAALTVVSEARHHTAERLGAVLEDRPPRMVLESGDRAAVARLELALEQHVADHPPVAGHRMERQDPRAGQLGARPIAVEVPEQLVAAADREHRGTSLHGLPKRLALARDVPCNQRLLAVLPAADVQKVVGARDDRIAHPDRPNLELVPTPLGPPRQHRDVAAVGVDVQVLGVQVTDADPHAARSQYGFTYPRSATIPRSRSMAV